MRATVVLVFCVVVGLVGVTLPAAAQTYWSEIGSGSGRMLWTGDYDWWHGLYFYAGSTYRFTLVMPCSADFDLYVYRVTGRDWSGNKTYSLLCKGTLGRCITEDFTCYVSTSGNYELKVVSFSGSGSYTLRVYRRR